VPPERAVITIVDDDKATCRTLALLVESMGYEVTTYGSVEAFLGDIERVPPNCLILDVNLPGACGLALQVRLRQEEQGIPVVVITASNDPSIRARALAFGACEFLTKPIESAALHRAVLKALESRG